MKNSALALLVTVVLAVLAVEFVADHDAWTPDEPRVAALGQSVAHGSWVVTRLDGVPFLEQPPLHAWSVAAAYRAFGETVAVARAVSVAWSVLSLLVTFLLADHLAGRRAALLATLLLGTLAVFVWSQHRITADPPLAFFVTASTYASLRALTATTTRERWGGLLLAYCGASFAYLSKGVVGVGLAGFGFLAVVIALRDARLLLRAQLWLAPVCFALVTASYHVRLYEECGIEGLRTVAWENTVNRAATSMAHAHYGPEYDLWNFPPSFLPGTLFFAGGIAWFIRERSRLDAKTRLAWEMPLVWFFLGLVALSLVRSKREVYLLPLFPAAAVASGLWLERLLDRQDVSLFARGLVPLFGVALLAAGIALPVVAGGYLAQGWLVPIAGSAVAIVAAVGAQALAASERTDRALALVLVGGLGLFVAAERSLVPYVDARKGLGRPIAEAVALIPSSRAVYVLAPDETTVGVIPFYTGRSVAALPPRGDAVRPLEDARRDLLVHLHGEREMWVLAIEKREKPLVYESVKGLNPEVVKVWPGAREIRLLHFRAEAAR